MLHSVFVIIFVYKLYHGVRLVVRFLLRILQRSNSHIAFQETFQEDFKYSDFFQDQASQCIGDVIREFILVDLKWDLKGSLNPSHL